MVSSAPLAYVDEVEAVPGGASEGVGEDGPMVEVVEEQVRARD